MMRNLRIAGGAALLALAGATVLHGVAAADEFDDNDIHHVSKDHKNSHQGGDGSRGGKNKAECLVPLGLSLGAVASTGGNVDQCNSRGGNGGNGGAGDVDY